MKPTLLPGIHGLRAIAVLMIVMFHLHYVGTLALPDLAQVIATHFGMGVYLFFVISGFSLLYSTRVSETGTQWIRDYLVRRFFRIAPLYYTMLAFYFFFWQGSKSFRTLLVCVLFAFNLVPGKQEGIVWASWTIGVEMIFYALLPLVFLLIRSIRGYTIFSVITLAASYAGRFLLESADIQWPKYAQMAFISNTGFFGLGLLAGALFKSLNARFATPNTQKESSNQARTIQSLLIIFTLVAVILMLSPIGTTMAVLGRPDVLVWGIIFAAIVLWQ